MQPEKSKMTLDKKINTIMIGIVILAITVVVGVGVGMWVIFSGNSQIADLKNELLEQKNTSGNGENLGTANHSERYCNGTYYGELLLDETPRKYTYTLNYDGTFTRSVEEGTKSYGAIGVYLIKSNTISLIAMDEANGSRDDDTYYKTNDYIIADDCSYIKAINGLGDYFILNRQ